MAFILIAIAATIPILIWTIIFYQFRPENKKMLAMTFIAGCFSTGIIFYYQSFWGQSINLLFFEIQAVDFKNSLTSFSTEYFTQSFLVFVFGVGMMEEFIKHIVIRKEKPAGLVLFVIFILTCITIFIFFKIITLSYTLNHIVLLGIMWGTFYLFYLVHKQLKYTSIDQVILVSIMSALGFAFIENIHYGFNIIKMPHWNTGTLISVMLGRSILVVMVHTLCSGIFGYYYGLSLFAGPYLKKHEGEKKNFFLFTWLQKILHFSKKTLFAEEKLFQGLLLAMFFHGIYDFILEINFNISHLFALIGIKTSFNFPLYPFFMVIYLIGGYLFLEYLLQEKKNHIKFGLVGTKAMPEEDYVNLIKKIKNIEHNKEVKARFLKDGYGTNEELIQLQKQTAYLKKYKLLHEKYINNKWISPANFYIYQKEIELIASESA